MTSLKAQIPMKVCSTPRIADDTICVTGEVTLTESRPAMHIKKPSTPCVQVSGLSYDWYTAWTYGYDRAVREDPQRFTAGEKRGDPSRFAENEDDGCEQNGGADIGVIRQYNGRIVDQA